MSTDNGIMFTEEGFPTGLMQGRWRAKGAKVALQPRGQLIEQDLSATVYFRAVWRQAFPLRLPLPFGEIATDDGRLSDLMLTSVWS
jgi:hypothetical protein